MYDFPHDTAMAPSLGSSSLGGPLAASAVSAASAASAATATATAGLTGERGDLAEFVGSSIGKHGGLTWFNHQQIGISCELIGVNGIHVSRVG